MSLAEHCLSIGIFCALIGGGDYVFSTTTSWLYAAMMAFAVAGGAYALKVFRHG